MSSRKELITHLPVPMNIAVSVTKKAVDNITKIQTSRFSLLVFMNSKIYGQNSKIKETVYNLSIATVGSQIAEKIYS